MKAPRSCFWALCAVLSMSTAYSGDVHYLQEGMKASVARKLILKNQWVPNLSQISRESPMWGQQAQLFQRGYTEVDRCAVDRSVFILKYRKKQACLEVEIEGENASQMRVIGWSHDCQPDR